MSASPPSAVRDLCIALAHRQKPGSIFVILTAYLDESGTHGGDGTEANPPSPITIMGGMLGTAMQWARYAGSVDELRRRYGFKVLHMKDFKQQKGEFSGWSIPKCRSFIREFGGIVDGKHLMWGITYRIDNAEFSSEFLGAPTPRGARLDTAYGFCFRNCVYFLTLEAERRLGHHKRWDETKLHFVLESGHKNAGDAIRIFDEMKGDYERAGIPLLGTISFLKKKESVELMVADYLATTIWSMERSVRSGELTGDQVFGGKNRGTGNVAHLTHKPGSMPRLKEEFAARAKRRRWQQKLKASSTAAPQAYGSSS